MATISPLGFYSGSTKKEYQSFLNKLVNVSKQEEVFKSRPFPAQNKESVFAPHHVWNCFPRQQQALENAEECKTRISKNIHVFARELSTDGQRQYIVTTYKDFWSHYTKVPSKKRNFYELIPPGMPCRLYFDLEFSKEANPDLNEVDVLETFVHLVCHYLKTLFDINCNRSNIIDLDSSTAAKFSRHLILHLPKAVFADNAACGNLMKYIYEMTRRKLDDNGAAENNLSSMNIKYEIILPPDDISVDNLFVQNKDGDKSFFCDLSVYSRNRNFRIYGSTKIRKDAYLVPSAENCFEISHAKRIENESEIDAEYSFFLRTLVCFDEDPKLNDFRVLNFGEVTSLYHRKMHRTDEGYQSLQEEGYKTSPFPKLDAFISTQICTGGVQGIIRRWVHFPKTNTVVYDIDRNHWCENIGRAHKSNHIYLVVDMGHGVFFQKCHDPDCQIIDYKSEEMPLPPDVNPALNDSDFMIDPFDDSSEDLIAAVEIAECEELFSGLDDDDDGGFNFDFGSQCKVTETIDLEDEFFLDDFDLISMDESDPADTLKNQIA